MPRFIERAGLPSAVLCAALCAALSACTFQPRREAAADPHLRDRPAVPAAVQAEFDAAVAVLRARRWAQAEPRLQQLAEREPQLSGPLLNLALLYAQTGRAELAEQHFRRAIEVNPDNLAALNQYGIWLREQGRFGEAEAAYRQALARRADFPDTHLNLGILYDLYLGRLPEALRHYQRYLELRGEKNTPVRGWVADLQRRLPDAG